MSRAGSAALALAVFLAWMGGALFHFHAGSALGCKTCQALQANQAELPVQGHATRSLATCERVAATSPAQAVEVLLLVPQGRAPPLA